MEKTLKNYSLSITMAILFFLSWFFQGVFQWKEYVIEQTEKKIVPTISDFKPQFLARTHKNWQSEFLQLLTFVVLTSFLIHKGSPESKDGDEEMKNMLVEINKKIDT